MTNEDPSRALLNSFTEVSLALVASQIRRQRMLYQHAVESMEPDHFYHYSSSHTRRTKRRPKKNQLS
jgi:hypothetical protein